MLDPTLARPRFKPVGITKGPGENTHEYTFVSRDDEQELKNGEYVYYELSDLDDTERADKSAVGAINRTLHVLPIEPADPQGSRPRSSSGVAGSHFKALPIEPADPQGSRASERHRLGDG